MAMNRMAMTAIAIAVVVFLLIGCAGSHAADHDGSGNAAAPVTIRLHTWYELKNDNFEPVIQAFEKKFPDIKVEFVSNGTDSFEAMNRIDLAAASGEELDVIMLNDFATYAGRVAMEMFEPLDAYLRQDGLDARKEYSADTEVNGSVYGLPGKAMIGLVAMNEKHLQEAGLPIPKDWTWDDYLDYARKLTKPEGPHPRYGTYIHPWARYTTLAQMSRIENAYFVTDDGRSANIMNPYVRKSLEIRLQVEKDKSAAPYAEVVGRKLHYRQQYFHEDASMIPVGSYIINETGGTDAIPAAFRTVFAPYPKFGRDDPPTTFSGNDILAVYSKSKHKKEAYTFIRWYTTEGIMLQGKFIPSWNKANLTEAVDHIIAGSKSPEMIDRESLLYVLMHSVPANRNTPLAYRAGVEQVMQDEFDRMMLRGQDIDTTMRNAQDKIERLIDPNHSRP